MKFGQQIRWLNGNEWHVGSVVASYGNNIFGVTHVCNPTPNQTKPEFRVRYFNNNWHVIDMAQQAPTQMGMGGGKHLGDLAYGKPAGEPVGAGTMFYREQYKMMKQMTGR